jgi:hypothetical protein
MKLRNTLLIVTLVMIPGSVWAYGDGSSGGTEGCKANFSKFMPANNAEVAAKNDFSFFASGETNPSSITVKIKGQSIPVTVTPKNEGFQVTGILPDTLKGTFAKINIAAKGPGQCEASGGWLVKVTE